MCLPKDIDGPQLPRFSQDDAPIFDAATTCQFFDAATTLQQLCLLACKLHTITRSSTAIRYRTSTGRKSSRHCPLFDAYETH